MKRLWITFIFLLAAGLGILAVAQNIAVSSSQTGTGNVVLANTPTLVTPVLGAATGTSLALGGGTALTTTNQTGTGSLVLATTPTLVTPVLGAATGTSVTLTGQSKSAGYIDTTVGFLASAMGAQSTATCTPITNMTWNLAASKNYLLSCEVPITFAASATVAFCLGGPGTATSYSLEADGPIGTAAAYSQITTLAQTSYGTKTGASAAVGAGEWIHVRANIQNGSTASGTALTLQTAANGTNNITVGANATCSLTQAN